MSASAIPKRVRLLDRQLRMIAGGLGDTARMYVWFRVLLEREGATLAFRA